MDVSKEAVKVPTCPKLIGNNILSVKTREGSYGTLFVDTLN